MQNLIQASNIVLSMNLFCLVHSLLGATVDVNSLPDDVSNASFVAGEFSCSGAESNLTDCAFNRDFCCQSNQPAPVLCQGKNTSCCTCVYF